MSIDQENLIDKTRERELIEEEKVAQYLKEHQREISTRKLTVKNLRRPCE